jgi:hypothetical protein
MARTKIQAGTLPDAFRYTPGDGRRYLWNGGDWIAVDTITVKAGVVTFTPTGDLIPVPEGSARTATVLMSTVDMWRSVQGDLRKGSMPRMIITVPR